MSERVIIIGAGGFGREVLDVVKAVNVACGEDYFDLMGVVDDRPSAVNHERLMRLGVRYLGTSQDWFEREIPASYVLGIGAPQIRARVGAEWHRRGYKAATVIHPAAVVGSGARVGAGVVVCAGVQVSTNVTLGNHVHVNPNATVGHDCILDEFVSVNPGAVISGDVRLGSGCLIGAGAVILQGLTIGHDATIGAAACVVSGVDACSTVKGVPARP